jgi:putative membrane protein
MADQLDKFLSAEERERIKACVAEVEKTTAGEIVPMLVPSSYDYSKAEIMGGLCLSLPVSMLAAWTFGVHNTWSFLGVFAALFVAAYFAVKLVPGLKRLFIPASEMDEEVHEGAVVSFYEHNLHETRDRTGVMIYVSVFERKVVVLADKGINAKVGQGQWQEIVDMVVAGIKSGKAADSLCDAVTRCGEIIAGHFPRREDDKNELLDLIIEG